MPAGWYADIEDAKRLADQLRKAKDERGAEVITRLVTELGKFRRGEQPSEIPVETGPPPPSAPPAEGDAPA